MIARTSRADSTRYSSPEYLTSVPPYLLYRTTSPTETSSGTRLPLSSKRPGPTAMTVPSCGFSFAVSGMTMPEAVVVSASFAWTTRRSSSGLMLTLVAVTVNLPFSGLYVRWRCPAAVAGVSRSPVGTLTRRVPTLNAGGRRALFRSRERVLAPRLPGVQGRPDRAAVRRDRAANGRRLEPEPGHLARARAGVGAEARPGLATVVAAVRVVGRDEQYRRRGRAERRDRGAAERLPATGHELRTVVGGRDRELLAGRIRLPGCAQQRDRAVVRRRHQAGVDLPARAGILRAGGGAAVDPGGAVVDRGE